MKRKKVVIATINLKGTEYEFCIGPGNMPEAPQLTHMALIRRVEGSSEWESAMVGLGVSRDTALRKLAENFWRVGDIRGLVVTDSKLKEYVDAKIERLIEVKRIKKEEKEQEAKEEKERLLTMKAVMENELKIAVQMKRAKFKKGRVKVTTSDGSEEIDGFLMGTIWGYHKDTKGLHYNVTHLPTGMFVKNKLDRGQARELAYRFYLAPIYEKIDDESGIVARKIIDDFKDRIPIKEVW